MSSDTSSRSPALRTMRHSCAHLLAAAVQSLWPGARLGIGPATERGFYYDFELETPLRDEDLARIDERMRELKRRALPIERSKCGVEDAIERLRAAGQVFKAELAERLRDERGNEVLSFYALGDFVDLCSGPHVEDTRQIGAFALTGVSGAYWRGDATRAQLQRVSGTCFAEADELAHELWRREEAARRDHRRIGVAQKLFSFSPEVGSGFPIWLPRGAALRDEIEHLARQQERREGYQRVSTPHVARESLYRRSRHLLYYGDEMYPLEIEGERYFLKPMNCPHHHQVYLCEARSYRDLPLRIAEYGQVHRNEPSGATSGLMRARGFAQNDAHIYCRFDQAKDEFLRVMRLHARYYELFQIRDFRMQLALPDLGRIGKYVDQPDEWLAALSIVREAMEESGVPYTEVEGEAAFYGPKVDFTIENAVGGEVAISTNQLDFLSTQTFDLRYTGEDGDTHPVYVIHRAPLGSHERFIAFLIEHYGGRFPTWLAPIQVRVVAIASRHVRYAEQVRDTLAGELLRNGSGGLRVDVDPSGERMQKKIRRAQLDQVPYTLVVGDREIEDGTVSVRCRSGESLGALRPGEFLARIRGEVERRVDDLPLVDERVATRKRFC